MIGAISGTLLKDQKTAPNLEPQLLQRGRVTGLGGSRVDCAAAARTARKETAGISLA